jgi:hypothetical protein
MNLSFDDRPTDRPGTRDDDAAVAIAVRAHAGSVRISNNDGFAERQAVLLRSGEICRLAGAGQSKTSDNPRTILPRHFGAIDAIVSRLHDRGKTLRKTEAEVRRAGFSFA